MKRFVCFLALFSALLSLVSCSTEPTEAGQGPIRIVTTVFPSYDAARQIASGTDAAFEVTMLLPPGSESHDYEPSIGDISAVGECDLFICVGGETDAWVDGVISAVGGEVNVMRLMDTVELLCEEEHEHHGHGRDHGEEYDEHVWTTPANMAIITEAICAEVKKLSPELSEELDRCSAEYASAFRRLEEEYRRVAETAARDVLIIADRFPFRYLTESFELRYYAAFEGCSSSTEPPLSVIYELTEAAKGEGVSVILTAEMSDGNTADTVADECGAVVMELHSCHNVTKEDFESGVTCLELMRRNLDVLTSALN